MDANNKTSELTKIFTEKRQNFIVYVRMHFRELAETDVEDLLQDIFLNLFNRADITKPIENLTAYIYQSIRNKIIDYRRSKKELISLEEPVNGEDQQNLLALLSDSRTDIQEEIVQKEFRRKFQEALESLEPKHKAVWVATEIQGYSFKELAQMWKEPVGTLLARKHRAGKALQEMLKEYLE
jgi:RNA polymerase sigma factor (sigma-70 family)